MLPTKTNTSTNSMQPQLLDPPTQKQNNNHLFESVSSQHIFVETDVPPAKTNTSNNSMQPQLPDPPTQKRNNNHLFESVSKIELNVLKRDANLWREMKKSMKRKKYVSTKIGRTLIAMVLLHTPKIGLESASTTMALLVPR